MYASHSYLHTITRTTRTFFTRTRSRMHANLLNLIHQALWDTAGNVTLMNVVVIFMLLTLLSPFYGLTGAAVFAVLHGADHDAVPAAEESARRRARPHVSHRGRSLLDQPPHTQRHL